MDSLCSLSSRIIFQINLFFPSCFVCFSLPLLPLRQLLFFVFPLPLLLPLPPPLPVFPVKKSPHRQWSMDSLCSLSSRIIFQINLFFPSCFVCFSLPLLPLRQLLLFLSCFVCFSLPLLPLRQLLLFLSCSSFLSLSSSLPLLPVFPVKKSPHRQWSKLESRQHTGTQY